MEFKKAGVFSPCASLDSASMIKTLQALLNDYPSIKFTSVATDKKYHGFKVFFSEPEDSMVLEKIQLSSEGETIWVYPLTAFLMIPDVDHKKTALFERELRDAINKKIGKVLGVVKKDNSTQSKNWRIEIEVPEFRGLEPFQRTIYSDITLPIPGRNEEFTLKLWCRRCKMCGHFQHDCPRLKEETNNGPKMEAEENHAGSLEVGENFKERATSSPVRNSERTPKKFSNFSLETTERYAEKIGREEVMSFSKEKEKRILNNTITDTGGNINSNLLSENVIKKEIVELSQNLDKNVGSQKPENPEPNSSSKSSENEIFSNKSRGGFSSDDEDIEFIGYANNSAANISPSHASNSSRAEAKAFEEESRSPETKNFNVPAFSFSANPGPSHDSPSAAVKTPRGAEVTTALSERLQDCINQVCDTVKVLDRKQLDAFLIHVKKKSNPIRVALNYTPNTKGLKEQLQGILHMYYNTPQTGTKEDIQFIKWLNGLVERYDGSIPKKRKRTGKNDDETSAKR